MLLRHLQGVYDCMGVFKAPIQLYHLSTRDKVMKDLKADDVSITAENLLHDGLLPVLPV